ncbi:hypothetical protein M427DRAFT_379331 [Gonapodya prolifera JEL478]|uniref:Uncharacterized protein n=1 Tax=Gonapodya prolifera (strain JEL478) TaxID=1344416 RepID=A0A139AV71_GONPJ|nr:hypothetical protein M427DRAFT_379331 [Gonapodya prolifera JEL478]|eukprot:KXS20607.1 hypothetical protein M427DRAFT_379331 [Gonapodya prolifera JEL478]
MAEILESDLEGLVWLTSFFLKSQTQAMGHSLVLLRNASRLLVDVLRRTVEQRARVELNTLQKENVKENRTQTPYKLLMGHLVSLYLDLFQNLETHAIVPILSFLTSHLGQAFTPDLADNVLECCLVWDGGSLWASKVASGAVFGTEGSRGTVRGYMMAVVLACDEPMEVVVDDLLQVTESVKMIAGSNPSPFGEL